MTTQKFDWKTALAELFAATVNQQSLEEAVELMVSVSAGDNSYHDECLTTLNEAVRAAGTGDSSVIVCINKSGYQVATTTDATKLLNDFRTIYLKEHERARKQGVKSLHSCYRQANLSPWLANFDLNFPVQSITSHPAVTHRILSFFMKKIVPCSSPVSVKR